MKNLLIGVLIWLLAGCLNGSSPPPNARIMLEDVFAPLRFSAPVAMLQAPGDSDWFYVLEQAGTVQRFHRASPAGTRAQVIDIRARVDFDGEKGLLGMAFHPDYQTNHRVFLSYTGPCPEGLCSFITEAAFIPDAQTKIPVLGAQKILLQLKQPHPNHNGGQIAFGPDGKLYIGLGDGGSSGDPDKNGQNPNTLLGKLLRIDVDSGQPYAIPADNPFVSNANARPEIYAYGLRNPWRWSFDRQTGELWLADVGQNQWEEVNLITAGGNYGWNPREGSHCYVETACNNPGFIDPVTEYSHDEGQSITGGYVYRGAALPQLEGTYIFGDFVSGTVWGYANNARSVLLNGTGVYISSFAEDASGELYVLDYTSGRVLKIAAAR
ncbi:MAG: PQQ-dependent sugar dehydrogenase [Pseudomonadota bacterium]